MYIDDEFIPWIISNKIPRRKYRIFQNRDGFYIKRKVFQGWIKVKESSNAFGDDFKCKYFLTEEIASEYITRLSLTKCYLKPNTFIEKLLTIILGIIIFYAIYKYNN